MVAVPAVPDAYRNLESVRAALAGLLPELPPSAALDLLVRLEIPVPERLEFLRDIIHSPEYPDHVRAAATLTLPRISSRHAVEELAEILSEEGMEELVVAKTVTLLGRLGDSGHISVLMNTEEATNSETVRELARSAVNVARSRHHLPGLRFPAYETRRPDDEATVEISGSDAGFPVKDETVAGIARMFPGVTRDDFRVHELRCGETMMTLAVRAELVANPGLLRETTHLAGAVSVAHTQTEELEPIHLAMTEPAGDWLRLWVTRLTGELLYVGEGGPDAGGLIFKLTSVAGPGVPLIWADVRLVEGRLDVYGRSARRIQRGRRPEPLPGGLTGSG